MWFRRSPTEVTHLGNWFDYLTIVAGSFSAFSGSDWSFRRLLLLSTLVGTLSSLRAPRGTVTDIAKHAFLWAVAVTLIQISLVTCFAMGIALGFRNLQDIPPDDRQYYTGLYLISMPLVWGVFVMYWNLLVSLSVGFLVGICRTVFDRQHDRC